MLGKKQNDSYYIVANSYDYYEKKIITTVAESDGKNKYEFIASYEQNIDPKLYSMLKKARNYSFSPDEADELQKMYLHEVISSVNSLLAENNLEISDIDVIALENIALTKHCNIDIASIVKQELSVPVIFNIKENNINNFLPVLTSQQKDKVDVLINLSNDFDIYTINEQSHFVGKTIGFSVLNYLSMYLNVDKDEISYLIGQGEIDEAIIKKIENIEELDVLQKELINIIIFSDISKSDKLKTAFEVIKMCLFGTLQEFDSNSKILLTGNTVLIEDLNQTLLNSFENISILSDSKQRQNTLFNEYLSYEGAKKHSDVNYDNGVKIV